MMANDIKTPVLLVDLVNDPAGHFHIMQALSRMPASRCIDTEERKCSLRHKPFTGLLERLRMFFRVKRRIDMYKGSPHIVHFLTADKFIFTPLFRMLRRKDRRVFITFHQLPQNPFTRFLLKRLAKDVDKVVVLSEYLASEFRKLGVNNVIVATHPSFYDYSSIPSKEKLQLEAGCNDRIVISALGGTRKEKGLDLLLSALQMLPESDKRKIFVNIAGKPQTFKKHYIRRRLSDTSIKFRLEMRLLPQEDFCRNVIMSDIIVLPYRKSFIGASGPFSEAASQGIAVICPNHGSMYDMLSRYGLGRCFESENPHSLSRTISEMINHPDRLNHQGNEIFSLDKFIEKHIEFYNAAFDNYPGI